MESLPSELVDKIDFHAHPKTTIHDLPVAIQKIIARDIRDKNIESFVNVKREHAETVKELRDDINHFTVMNNMLISRAPRFDMTPVQARTFDQRAARIRELKREINVLNRLQTLKNRNFVPTYMPTMAAEIRGRRGEIPFPKPALRDIVKP